jgi:hypothetical protein
LAELDACEAEAALDGADRNAQGAREFGGREFLKFAEVKDVKGLRMEAI